MRIRPVRLASLAVALALAGPAAAPGWAQSSARPAPTVTQTWTLEPLHAGYCIAFLIDSATAREAVPDGYVAVPAGEAATLRPPVAGAVRARPDSFASWSPAELCLYWANTVDVDGRPVSEGDDRLQALGIWSILARPDDDAAAAPVGAVAGLYASNWRAARRARAEQLDVRRFSVAAGKVPVENAEGEYVPGPDDRYEIRIGKTTITWDGRFAGDSLAAPQPETGAWQAPGLRRTDWSIRSDVRPDRSAAVVGALRVTGTDDLARALQASPIRFVGPWHAGGSARVVFTR